jgi:hypothetical protein
VKKDHNGSANDMNVTRREEREREQERSCYASTFVLRSALVLVIPNPLCSPSSRPTVLLSADTAAFDPLPESNIPIAIPPRCCDCGDGVEELNECGEGGSWCRDTDELGGAALLSPDERDDVRECEYG